MKWLLAIFVLIATPALAVDPPKTLSFTVTTAEATLIVNELGKLPWKDINPLMTSLINQINAQFAPKSAWPPG